LLLLLLLLLLMHRRADRTDNRIAFAAASLLAAV
jgi:hypothetical protein